MSRRLQELEKPQIRKSFLVVGAAVLGAVLLGFVLMNFVLGGGGGAPAVTPDPASIVVPEQKLLPEKEHEPLRPGGRDPFVVGMSAHSATVSFQIL